MSKYKTMQGGVIELTDQEYYDYPRNSTLTKVKEEEVKIKKIIKKKDMESDIYG